MISKKLVTLKKDVPIKNKITDFKLKEIDIEKDKLYDFLREMEFNRLLSTVISTYGEMGFELDKKVKKNKDQKINNKNYKLIENEKDIDEYLREAEEQGEFAIDTETTSLDPHQADLVGISLSTKLGNACYIPLGHTSKKI